MNKEESFLKSQSGRIIHPFALQPHEIDIEEIATTLSKLCRWAGMINEFYSVAAHCIQVSYWVEYFNGSKAEQLTGLLHDASEGLGCGDLPTPIKKFIPGYVVMEDAVQSVIMNKYGLSYPYPDIVHRADRAALIHEAINLKDPDPFWSDQKIPVPYSVECRRSSPSRGLSAHKHIEYMSKMFLERFQELGGKI